MDQRPRLAHLRPITEYESFKQQESTFVLLNLFVLAALLLIHTLFASYWGEPSRSLIAILAAAFLAQGAELFWLQMRERPLEPKAIVPLGWLLIFFNIVLAIALATATNRPDTQYFVLLVIPVLVAAFRLELLPMIGIVVLVDFINVFWVWTYGRQQPQPPVGEYFEAMTVSLIYAIVGVLVWLLVDNLHEKESRLSKSLKDLEQARERAVREEKLAAVGRLAGAIAHEIRNPVAAIASALTTARRGGLQSQEREEMFQIASKEADRLERLTTDFLTYARPRGPQRTVWSLDDLLGYVAEVCRPRAAEKGIGLRVEDHCGLTAEMDPGQLQQALVNIVMNAVEASESGGHVVLRADADGQAGIRIEAKNDGGAVPPEIAARIFEPFFTTKQSGTGLGLAIARSIATAHGGDLTLSQNEPGRVCFALRLPASASLEESLEGAWAEY